MARSRARRCRKPDDVAIPYIDAHTWITKTICRHIGARQVSTLTSIKEGIAALHRATPPRHCEESCATPSQIRRRGNPLHQRSRLNHLHDLPTNRSTSVYFVHRHEKGDCRAPLLSPTLQLAMTRWGYQTLVIKNFFSVLLESFPQKTQHRWLKR
jgi:hypothetical protein